MQIRVKASRVKVVVALSETTKLVSLLHEEMGVPGDCTLVLTIKGPIDRPTEMELAIVDDEG